MVYRILHRSPAYSGNNRNCFVIYWDWLRIDLNRVGFDYLVNFSGDGAFAHCGATAAEKNRAADQQDIYFLHT